MVAFSDCVNHADVWMIERGSHARLPPKPFQRLWILRQFSRQELHRDMTSETGIFGLVHHTHTAGSEFLEDAVMRDSLAD